MPLQAGARLGPYEIVAPLGAGGMGEVYRATDTKLGRDVALKLLTAVSDPVARGRFEREARTIAALNHPNIVTIFGVDEADGQSFLAMELVEGRTLGELIPSSGMPVATLLQHAIPIADALSAAHAQGITHRDLKPSNVMVSKDGRVKVLDFGLAKLRDDVGQLDASVAATRPITREGQIVGTVAYMAPEQASGSTIDSRSDLFSLGVMLYEMATGERPFAGAGSVETLASILRDTPRPITEVRTHLPRDLARIVRRALAKDPEQRYQTAKDLRNDLQTLKEDLTSGDLSTTVPTMPLRSKRSGAVLVGVAVGAAALGAVAVYVAVRSRAPDARPPDATATISRLTTTGRAALAAISSDGKYVAYVANDDGAYSVWMRQTATASNVQIVPAGPDRYNGLAFSPDGDYVYFTRFSSRTGADVYRVPLLGGPPQPVISDVDSPVAFSPDGTRIAFLRGYPTRNEISIVVGPVTGTGPWDRIATRPFTSGFIIPSRVVWLPDGRTIAAAVGGMRLSGFINASRSSIVAIDVATGRERPLTAVVWDNIETLAVLTDASLVVSGTQQGRPNNQLWRVLPDGSVRRLTNDLNAYSDVAAASNAAAIVAVLDDFSSTISTTTSLGTAFATRVTTGTGRHDGETGIAWTPDGRVVFGSAAGGQLDLWIADADGRNARQLTSDAAAEATPTVSADGRAVLFSANRQNQAGIWRLDLANGRTARVTDDPGDYFPQCLPDNETVVFTRHVADGLGAYEVKLSGGAPSRRSIGDVWPLAVSPDGRRLLAFATRPDNEIAVLPFADPSAVRRFDIVSLPLMLAFAPHADVLTFLESRKGPQALWNQPLDGGTPMPLLALKGDRVFSFAYARDGRIAVAHGPSRSDVILMSGIR